MFQLMVLNRVANICFLLNTVKKFGEIIATVSDCIVILYKITIVMTDNISLRLRTVFINILPLILECTLLSAQVTDYQGMAEKARTEFVNGRYEEALNDYRELKSLFLQNPEYRYYIGRCLLKLDPYNEETSENLKFAAVKGDENDAWFFLGKAYHLNGEYQKAVYAYKRFRSSGKKADIRKLNVKELQTMAENKNRLSSDKLFLADRENNTVVKKTEKKDIKDNKANEMSSAGSTEDVRTQRETENVSYMTETADDEDKRMKRDIPSVVDVKTNNRHQNDPVLTKALGLQLIADSLRRTARMKRADLKETGAAEERNKLISEIYRLEKESAEMQRAADDLFKNMEGISFPESDDDTIRNDEIIELKEEINGIRVYQYKSDVIANENQVVIEKAESPDDKEKTKDIKDFAGNGLFFRDKSMYSDKNPVPLRHHFTERLVYQIQLGVFSKKADHTSFGTLSPVCYEEIGDKGLFKYYAGLFATYKAATESLAILRSKGYQDSFIVAFNKGKQIPLDKARQIEYAQIKF